MSILAALAAASAPVRSPDWMGVAARPGSGIGFLPVAFSVQPLATAAALVLTAAAAWGCGISPRR